MVTVGYKLTNISANAARSVVVNKRYGIKGDPLVADTPIRMDVISAGKGFHTRVTVGPLTDDQRRHPALSALVVRFYATAEWVDPLDRPQERRLYRAVRVGPQGAVESIYRSPDKSSAAEEQAIAPNAGLSKARTSYLLPTFYLPPPTLCARASSPQPSPPAVRAARCP